MSWRWGLIVVGVLMLSVSTFALALSSRALARRQRELGESQATANRPLSLPWPPGRSLARTAHQIYLYRDNSTQLIYDTPDYLLGMAPVHLPHHRPLLVVLTAERSEGLSFLGSHLYLLDPDDPASPRPLSPEPTYNFWDLSTGDVDGDGVEEVGLCTWSRTVKDPDFANRYFIYGWTSEGDLYPRWRGSRLCRPYVWAGLLDVAGDDRAELVSVETGLGGGQMLVAYEWNQFGFWGLGTSAEYPNLYVLHAERCRAGDKVVWAAFHPDPLRPETRLFALQGNRWQAYLTLVQIVSEGPPCPFPLPPAPYGEHAYVSGARPSEGHGVPLPEGQ